MIPINNIRTVAKAISVLPHASNRTLGQLADTSHQSAMRLKERFSLAELSYDNVKQLSDDELRKKLYPALANRKKTKRQPDVAYIVSELTKSKRKAKTASVLYLEYVAINPENAMGRSNFSRIVNKALKRSKMTMKQVHSAGEVLYIDYAGHKIYFMSKGKKVWVKVFVAVLGASKKIFAWATYGEKTCHWIDGMTRAVEHIGGVTETVSMDNAKALVTKPGLIPNLNDNIKAFGLHYDAIMDSCRVGRPQDKSHAELGVKFVTQRILRPMMQDHTFFSLDEINKYLMEKVEELNNLPLQGLDVSRNELFEKNEKAALKPLPAATYLMIVDRFSQKVGPNYHVKYQKCEYSIPYQHRGETVDIVVDQSNLRVFLNNQLVATHSVAAETCSSSTKPEHMPFEHLVDYMSMDKKSNLEWAKSKGESIEQVVSNWYANTKNPRSRVVAKRCKALMSLCKKNGDKVLLEACHYANTHGLTTPDDISLIIRARGSKHNFEELPTFIPAHKNIRGKEYYGDRYEA